MKKLALATALGALVLAACAAVAQEQTKPEEKPMSTTANAPVTSTTTTTVAPGGVKWRASFEDAVAAARAASKPVLHFQLLGKLDQEFC